MIRRLAARRAATSCDQWKSIRTVASGVPQDSVLDPAFFMIYFNDIDVGLNHKISRIVDDIELGKTALSED